MLIKRNKNLSPELREFINECYPKGLPKYKKREIEAELSSHIYEKSDYYAENGESQSQSLKMAINDMGNPTEIKKSFSSVYKNERVPALITFFAIVFFTFITIPLGFIYSSADFVGDFPTFFHVFYSLTFIFGCIFLMIYAFRKKMLLMLVSISAAFSVVCALFMLSVGLFQSTTLGITLIISALFGMGEETAETFVNDFGIIASFFVPFIMFLAAIVLTLVVLLGTFGIKRRQKGKLRPLKWYLFTFLSLNVLVCVFFGICANTYEFSNPWNNSLVNYIKVQHDEYTLSVTYEKITPEMSKGEIEVLLREKGFRKYEKPYGVYSMDSYEPGYSMENADIYHLVSKDYDSIGIGNRAIIVKFNNEKLCFKQMTDSSFGASLMLLGHRSCDTSDFFEQMSDIKKGLPYDEFMLKDLNRSNCRVVYRWISYEDNTASEYYESRGRSLNSVRYADISLKVFFSDGKLEYSDCIFFGQDEKYDYSKFDKNDYCVSW